MPWGSGALLGSAVHGSDERAQAIPGLLAPDPQDTTSFANVEVVASIEGKRSLGNRAFVERGKPRSTRAGQVETMAGAQGSRAREPSKGAEQGTKPRPQSTEKTRQCGGMAQAAQGCAALGRRRQDAGAGRCAIPPHCRGSRRSPPNRMPLLPKPAQSDALAPAVLAFSHRGEEPGKKKDGRKARLRLSVWRKGWDSNPRYRRPVHRISNPAHSTTLPPFRGPAAWSGRGARHDTEPARGVQPRPPAHGLWLDCRPVPR